MKKIVLVGLLFIALGGIYYFSLDKDAYPIKRVKVHADFKEIKRKDFRKILSPIIAQGFFHASTREVKEALKQMAWVDTVEVQKKWPDTFVITLTEKKPFARWGEKLLISKQGEKLLPETLQDFQDLPLLLAEDGNELLVISEYRNISQIFRRIGQRVVEYSVSPRFTRSLKLANGVTINLGHQTVEKRLTRFIDVYFAMFHDKFNNISYIDLRYPKGVAVRFDENKA